LHDLEAEWNAAKHPAYAQTAHPINFVLSRIQGGDWTSSVPAQCIMDVRLGIYPDREVADCQREIETVLHQALVSNPKLTNMQARLTYHGFLSPGYVLPPDTLPERLCATLITLSAKAPWRPASALRSPMPASLGCIKTHQPWSMGRFVRMPMASTSGSTSNRCARLLR
jgi:hypothetical protein